MRKISILEGVGRLVGKNNLAVSSESGEKIVEFNSAIIAVGSQPAILPFLPRKNHLIVDSTGALSLRKIPKKMLLIGGGIISLEMGTIYSAFGTRLDVVENSDKLIRGADRDIVKIWQKKNQKRFNNIMLDTKVISTENFKDSIHVKFEGKDAPKDVQDYDLILQAVGRIPNGKKIDAHLAGVLVDEKGFIEVDSQMRTNVSHIFAIGDVVGQPMLAHKAVHEGHIAAENAAGKKSFFDAKVIPSVAYTNPEIAWVGLTEEEAQKKNIDIKLGLFPWSASGRAIANNNTDGLTKLIFDKKTDRLLGGSIVGNNAGDLISEIVLGIEMNSDSVDISKTIHPHPTLGESIGMSAEASNGICTDLPPFFKK